MRYNEEVQLIKEEMQRTLLTLEYSAYEWDECASVEFETCPIHQSGLMAYAARQANIHQVIKAKFSSIWSLRPSTASLQTEDLDVAGKHIEVARVNESETASDDDIDIPGDVDSEEK